MPSSRFIRISAARWAAAARLIAAAACSLGALATPAQAHGFGQRYDLPLPLSYYISGACAAIVVTFLVVALFVREAPRAQGYPRFDLESHGLGRLCAQPGLAFLLKFCGLAIFIITVIAGFRGYEDPYRNIAPTLVWIIWWVGLAYVCAFVGNLWTLINPWNTIFEAAETIYCGLTNRRLSLGLPYPKRLGVWPSCVLLLGFSWTELIYPSPAVPLHLAWLAIGYSALTFLGMFAFGRETWLRHGEVFSLVFGTFARFAPTEPCALRPFAAGLIESRDVSTSMMAFVLTLLSTVLFDGILGTPEWGIVENALAASLPGLGDTAFILIRTVGLIGFWLVFLGAFIAASALMSAVTRPRLLPLEMARSFALTLVPIAIGYHLAHYLTYLLIQGQYIIPLASDPFGFGWNLFGTAGYRVDIAVVGARFAWFAAVAAILLGHIAAVYLAHLKAMRIFGAGTALLRSQVPLTALMVVYTFVSLSILAEPIVARRTPAQPIAVTTSAEVSVPSDAVVPMLGSGVLSPVGRGRIAKQKLTYRVLASRFHDGTSMTTADLLYAYMFAYRWSAPGSATYDPYVDAATKLLRSRLVGFQVTGTDTASKSFRFGDITFTRPLFDVDVYLTTPPIEPEQDAIIAPPWSAVPWHLMALMEQAVMRGWAAFSQQEAKRRGVPWLDLVRDPGMNERLADLVAKFAQAGYRPKALQGVVSAEEARQRWTALAAFYKEHGHFLVTDGPYELKKWTSDSVSLEAFRDLSYPLGVGSFDNYAVPRRGTITAVKLAGSIITVSGDIEVLFKHMRSYDIVRKPLSSLPDDLLTSSAPECRYIITDHDGRVMLAGEVPIADDHSFHIDFGSKLQPGSYTFAAQIIVNSNAANDDIKRVPIVVAANS